MGMFTWKQAAADYEKKSAGSNTAGTTPPTSGMLSWKQAADEFDRYDEDGYKALVQKRVADREREYNARYSGLTVNTDTGFDEDAERNINAWINRYNQTMNGLRGGSNGKWFSKDAIDRYSRDVDSLVSQYDSIKDYASVYGFENSLSHYGKLREIQDAIKQQTGWHEKYNGKGHEDIEQILSGMEASDERDWLEASRYDIYKSLADYQQRAQSGLEAFENSNPKSVEEESWFDAVARYLGKVSDTTMALGDTSRMSAEYRKDTKYKEPADNWSEDQRNTYGYLYSINPEAASDFAVKTSENYRRAENQQKLGAIQEWATKNGVNASAGTVAAIAMMPLSLADTLNALTEYNARGTISTPSSPTPGQVSEAITGAVGQSLNEKHGTISEKIPVIGGKGWGDAYQLGTSIANSLLSAYTQGSVGTDILFFGSAASSSMYSAKDRGATDEQAIKLGVLSGLAEAAGEHFSIEGLIGMSEANTMKAFFGNVLKQSGIEASEEGFTTLMNNFADQLIMGKDSAFYEKVRTYMSENGMSEQEAKKQAWKDMAEDLAFDMVGGAFSGGVSTGIQTGAQKIFGGTQQVQTHHEPLATENFGNATELANSEEEATIDESSAVNDKLSETEGMPTLESLSEKYGDRAADMRKTFFEGQDVLEYDAAFKMAYEMGKAGVTESAMHKSDATVYLSEIQRSVAYNMGVLDAQSAASAQAARNAAAANGKTGWHKGIVKGQGVKIADMSKAFNDPQRKAYKYLTNIAEVTGVDIVLYKSETDADGNYQGAQGKFKWNENTIYIDINAGLDSYANADQLAKYTMMRTFDHEFTHFIEKWNPEEYNSFRILVFETMESNGTNVEDAIELMMEKTGNTMTYDQAAREVIAEAMTDILPETSFIEQLARKNQNVFQQLLSKLKEFLTSIKQHFASMSSSTQEAKALKKKMGETVSYMEEIVKKFDEVAVKAVENYQRTVAEDATVSKEEKVVAKTETTTDTTTEETVTETEDTVSETEETVTASEDASSDESPAPAAEEYRSEHSYTIRPNEQYGSLEITFDSKPSQAVRDALKVNKFRWNGKKGVWYGKTDQKTIVDALDKAYQLKAAAPVDLSKKPMERTGDTVTIGDPVKATHEVEITLSDEEHEALVRAVPEKQEVAESATVTEAVQEESAPISPAKGAPVAAEDAAPVLEEKPDKQKKTAAKAAKPATVETSVKLEDFGEKIGGARKDQWSKRGLRADDLTDMNDRERDKNVKKDNVWKRPDYRKLIEGGADRNILFVRNEIRKALNQNIAYPYRTTEEQRLRIQKEFIETVREIQAMAEKVSSKEDLLAMGRTWLKANGYIQESGTSYTEKWRKNPALMGTDYVYTIEHLARNFDNLTKLADKANFAVDAEKKIPSGFSIHEDDSNHTWFIARGSWIVKHSFPSYDDALNYLRNAASNSKKKTRFVPQQLLEVHRKGPDYRSSEDVKGQDYLDTFGFKGGEFGNWMSEKDRRVSMNYGFDALKDLADALGIADTDISLGGNLSIAFGARGQGLSGAAAHYEQERHVINLTKMNGAGSLAHEWFHALDDFLGGYGSKFATEYGAKLPEATKAAVRHLLTTMQYRDATQEETDMAATKAYEQAKRSVTYQVSNQFGWVQKVENGTFQDHDARYYTRKPTAADVERYHVLLDKLLETGDAAIVDELSALRKEVTGHVIPKEDRDSIGFRLSALRPEATKNVQKMRLRSDFYNGSRRFGELHHKDGDYWDSTIEMAARAFACYVADKTGKHNDYLSAHSDTAATLDVDKNGNVSVVRAYPTGQERVQINAAFDQLFAALKEDGFLHQQGEVSKPDIIQYQRRPGEVRRFSYEWFTSKPDMPITEVEHIGKVNTKQQRNQIIEKAMENAKSVGTVNELGNPVVHVKDTGTDVMISKTGIRHSMDRRAGVVGSVAVKIGDILSNAILMNELNPRSENITDSYILIGAAKNKTNEPYIVSFVVNRYTSEVTDIDVLYAVNAKTEPAGSLSPSITAETAGYFTGSTVTISNLLDFVNQYFPDTMPEDVLKHYGHDRRPDGTLGQDALYQQRYGTLTDRDILDLAANDLRIDEMTEKERNALNVFRDRLAKLQKLQQERFDLGKQYRQQQFMPEGDRKAAASTLAQMRDLDSRIETISDKILDMEERSVLKEVLKKARKIVEQKQKEHDDEIIRNRRNRRNEAANARKYRQQITKNAKILMDWITKPSNKDIMKHVPDVLKDSVIPLLNQIDFTSKRQLNGKEATKADLEFAKRLKKVKAVLDKDISAAELNSGYYDFSPQFREKLDSVVAEVRVLAENSSGEFVMNRMSAKDLKDLAEVIHELKQLIQNYNRLHNNALFENAYEAGGSTIDEMSQYQNAPDRGKAGEAAHRFLFWKQMRPIHGWDRLGKGGLSVFHEFWSGHSRYAFNVKKVIDFTGKTFTEEEVNAWEKETADIELSDGLIVRMKIAHIMSFHELRKDADSLRHILGDGLRVPVYRASDGKKVSDDGHLLTIEDVNTIANSLTERQVEVADALQQFMATQGAKWGNEVSMKRFGEAMFTNPTYFPINSDGQRLQATINAREDGSDLYALLNVGFTKSRNENASNRIVLYSIFDVFTNHMATMAQYNAFALPVLDALKWLNYQKTEEITVTENGQQKTVRKTVDSVREQLNRVFGAPAEENGRAKRGYAEEFILNIIRDFNGSKIQGSPNEGLFKKLLHNYNVAQVSTNLSVAIQQISSIVRAGQVINYKSILRARKLKPEVVKRNISEMEKHSGIAVWKSMGFYDINVSRSLSDLIKHNASFQEKVNEKGLAGAELADKITWAAIWCSCKEEVLLRGMKYDDTGFFDAVTKLFDEVIYRTQVVDSILTKNEYMRDSSFIPRFTSSFMNESVTIASMVMSTMDKYQMDLQKGLSKQEAWKRNKKAIGVTVGIYSAGAILNAAFRAVMGAFRDDDEYETYGEKYWEAFKGNLVDELMPFNKIPIASDAYEIVKELVGVVTDYFWDYEIYGNAPETITGQLTDKGTKVVEILCQKLSGEDTSYTWYAAIYNLLQVASGISGLPMANLTREVVTFWNNTAGSLAPSLKVRTYEPTVKNAIKYAYLDGYLTYEEAAEELLTNNQVDSQNEAHWIIKSWEGGKGYSKFGAVYQAMLEDGDVDAEMANYLPYGYTETEVLNNVKSMIGTAFRDGEITKEAATDLLTRYFDMDTEDITAQINRWSAKVETGIAFDDIKDSFIYGEITEKQAIDMYMRYGGYTQKDARITVTEWKAQKETGVSMSDLEEQFVRGSVSERDAISRLQKYSGVAKTEAEARVQEWKCEKETGIPYDELSDRYVTGKITSTRAQELRVEYGGSSLEDARKTVLKWDCEKDHGIKYGELSTAYLSGDISKTDAINWQMEYGEKSRDDAELAVQAWVWRADNPKYKDLSDQKIDRFITHCVPAGIDVAFYYKAQDHVKKIVSDGTSGNVKNQYVDYILSLGLDSYRARAMWKALKNSTWKDTGTPFA